MTLNAGSKLGPYEVVGAAGAGGMGEVYRARDTRLERTVAIKVLPSHLSSNPDLKQRFEREAKAISSLQHPHICTLYDVGSQDGVDFLVMEYLEGETLAERIRRGPLALPELTRIGAEITEALDRAHRAGIVHRDLKPANVMLTNAGAKLMDFGLAKPLAMAAGVGTHPSNISGAPMLSAAMTSPNPQASPLTVAGTVVGTVQYMSPEQIEGKEADARSDIFAMGTVLYEMATGKRAFEGKSQLTVASAILEKEPEPLHLARPASPATLEHVIARCMAKNPDERWQTARDVGTELKWAATSKDMASVATRPSSLKSRLMVAAAAVGTAIVLITGYWMMPKPAGLNLHVAVNLPAGFRLDTTNNSIALSPDGTRLAFTAVGTDGLQRLWVRALNGQEPQALTGTDGATYPFWSPDGQSLGFFAKHKLKTIEIATGAVRALSDAPNGRGASWSSKGTIVFSPDYQTPLFAVPVSGGTPAQLTTLKLAGESHRLPWFLPDGRHLLFTVLQNVASKDDTVSWLDVDTRKTGAVMQERSQAQYAGGYILYHHGKTLMGRPFDVRSLQTQGQAAIVAEDVISNSERATGQYSISQTGVLLYATGPGIDPSLLTVYGEDGRKSHEVGQPAIFTDIHISPNGKKIAESVVRPDGLNDIWIYDLEGGNGRRLTFASDGRSNATWSPDSARIAFQGPASTVYEQPADGSSPERKLPIQLATSADYLQSWSPDGKSLAFMESDKNGLDIMVTPITSGEPRKYASTPAWETEATFSPDGNWIAYSSDETGRYEIFVVPFPSGQGKFQVSSDGGQLPVWINGGRELAYMNDQRKLLAVEMKSHGTQMEVGRSRALFGGQTLPVLPGLEASASGASPTYITPDGKQIVLAVPTNLSSATPLNLVTNWTSNLGLKK